MEAGDMVGHEPTGIVEEVGSSVTNLAVGDRVMVPFNVCCGSCWMCERNLYSQCETTQNHEHGTGASFFGYSNLYGQVPGGQAEYLRVPFPDFLPVKVPHEHSDDRFLFLSDVLPTAWRALKYADVPGGGTLLVLVRKCPARRDRRAADGDGRPGPTRRTAQAIDAVRRGGTIAISGVYGGSVDPMPMMQMFDKQVQRRMGQADVRPRSRPTTCRWMRRPTPTSTSRRRKRAW